MGFLHRTWAEIDSSALLHNFKIIREKAGLSKIMAVVKANAYGHSAPDIAPLLDKAGADSFAVSNLDEALQLRGLGIKKPILILGYTPVEATELLCKNKISQCIFSYEYAKELSKAVTLLGKQLNIHIKLDTGMCRLGFNCKDDKLSELDEAIRAAGLPGFHLEGVFTHFAFSDRVEMQDNGFTNQQFDLFKKSAEAFIKSGHKPDYCHCCNSAALLLDREKRLDLVRPGIILYGLTPNADLELKEELLPVMTLKSAVSMVKEISRGDTVSYGRTFKAKRKMKIATVTAGYADGYPRLLSNKGYVLINGQKAPIVGRICMDQFNADVSEIKDVKTGDEVILFGKELPVEEIAPLCDTINYEIVCGINSRVPRIMVNCDE